MSSLTFRQGFTHGIPICLGYFSVSFAFGMIAAERGFPIIFPILISVTNLTGTGQFAGMELAAAGAAISEIAFTVLIINLRYMLMSLSVSQKFCENYPMRKRLLTAFGITDEIYAVAGLRKPVPRVGDLCTRNCALCDVHCDNRAACFRIKTCSADSSRRSCGVMHIQICAVPKPCKQRLGDNHKRRINGCARRMACPRYLRRYRDPRG